MLIKLISLFLISCSLISCNGLFAPNINLNNYELIWEDQFNSSALNGEKWTHRYLGKRKKGINTISNVSIKDNKYLKISMKKRNNKIYTAMISTEKTFQTKYGYFEAMLKLPKSQGLQSAFWLQSSTYGEKIGDLNYSGAEIDILEYVKKTPNKIYHSIYYDGYKNHKKKIQESSKIDPNDWNKIALLWNKKGYYFFINDKLVFHTNKGLSHAKQYIVFSVEHTKWSGKTSKEFNEDSFLIDYIKVYKEKK